MNQSRIAAAVVFASAAAAVAGPVTFDYDGVGRGQTVSVESDGFYSGNVYAGSVRHIVDGELQFTYCIEPDQWAQGSTKTFEQTTVSNALSHRTASAAKAAAIAELADSIGDSLWTESIDRNVAAAFQVAVWEIVRDFDSSSESESLRLDTGTFRATAGVDIISRAETMLASLTFGRGNDAGYVAFTHEKHQDFIGRTVPTPAALSLAGVALPLMGKRRRGA